MTKKRWIAVGTVAVILFVIGILFRMEKIVIIQDSQIRREVKAQLGIASEKRGALFYPWETSQFIKVESLSLEGSVNVRELRYFSNMKELYLDATGGTLRGIETLSEMENLEQLTIRAADISDPGIFKNVESLTLWNCRVENIEKLGQCKDLQFLEIDDGSLEFTTIDDLGFLKCLRKLETLSLPDMGVSDIKDIIQLDELKQLFLSGNNISNLEGIEQLEDLEVLYISRNPIENIEENLERIGLLKKLKVFRATELGITSLEWVKELKNLERLYISQNPIEDIEELTGLSQLKVLVADDCKITDLSPLKELENLERVSVERNPIEDDSVLEEIEIKYANIE